MDLKEIYFTKSQNEIGCLRGQKIKRIGDGFGHAGQVAFGNKHQFLKTLTESMNYKADTEIRRKSDQLIRHTRVPLKVLDLTKDKNVDNHIDEGKKIVEKRQTLMEKKRSERASTNCVLFYQEEELKEEDEEEDCPFEQAKDVQQEPIHDVESTEISSPSKRRTGANNRSRAYSIIVEPVVDTDPTTPADDFIDFKDYKDVCSSIGRRTVTTNDVSAVSD